jgi:hypothetical protein
MLTLNHLSVGFGLILAILIVVKVNQAIISLALNLIPHNPYLKTKHNAHPLSDPL